MSVIVVSLTSAPLLLSSGRTSPLMTASREEAPRARILRRLADRTDIEVTAFVLLICPSCLLPCLFVCVPLCLDVRGGLQRKQSAPVSAAGHPENYQSDQAGLGKGHTGDDSDTQTITVNIPIQRQKKAS